MLSRSFSSRAAQILLKCSTVRWRFGFLRLPKILNILHEVGAHQSHIVNTKHWNQLHVSFGLLRSVVCAKVMLYRLVFFTPSSNIFSMLTMAFPDNGHIRWSVAIPFVIQQRCLNKRKVRSAISATAGLVGNAYHPQCHSSDGHRTNGLGLGLVVG